MVAGMVMMVMVVVEAVLVLMVFGSCIILVISFKLFHPRLLAQTSLRNILGTKNLHEILSDRDSISNSMQTILDDATTAWGIKVERVEM